MGLFGTAFLTLFTPLAAYTSPWAVVALRIMEGLLEGVTYPAMHEMWSKWAPPLERSKLVTFSYAGSNLGTVFALPVCGFLCASPLKWESVFYGFGMIGCLWFIGWLCFTSNSPAVHPRIDPLERTYIEESLAKEQSKEFPTPWRKIAVSLPVWALTIAHVGYCWILYTLITYLPTYMHDVLAFDIKSNGMLSALPYLMSWCVAVSGGLIADCLQRKQYLSTGATRKVFQASGTLIPGCLMIAVGWVGCDKVLAILILCIAAGISGLCLAGYQSNHLDIAPQFAGILLGITNTVATVAGIVSPYAVGAITTNNNTFDAWRIVFYIIAGVCGFSAIFFCIFGSGEIQPWARSPPSQQEL